MVRKNITKDLGLKRGSHIYLFLNPTKNKYICTLNLESYGN